MPTRLINLKLYVRKHKKPLSKRRETWKLYNRSLCTYVLSFISTNRFSSQI